MNSDGKLRGSKIVEHACDIVIGFSGEKDQPRFAYNEKNRYGSAVSELLVFHLPADQKRAQGASETISWAELEQQRMALDARRRKLAWSNQ